MISILSKIHNFPVTRAINMKSWKMKRHWVIVIMIDFHLTQINIWSLIRSALLWDEMIDLFQSWKRAVQRRLHHKCVVDISIFFPAFKVYLGQGCICGVQWKFFALLFCSVCDKCSKRVINWSSWWWPPCTYLVEMIVHYDLHSGVGAK